MGIHLTRDEFILKCSRVHENKYDYSKTEFLRLLDNITVICPIHGEFSIRANLLLHGSGCRKCGSISASKARRNLDQDIISRAKAIWGDQFDYSEMNFRGMRHFCKIKCNLCGEWFQQKMDKHINAKQNGCPNCASHLAWTRTSWIDYCENKNQLEPHVYIVRLFNDNESFVKIGITSNSVFSRMWKIPYQYEVIRQIIGDPKFVYDKENELHKKYKGFRYKPKIEFGGHTECFSLDILPLIDHLT